MELLTGKCKEAFEKWFEYNVNASYIRGVNYHQVISKDVFKLPLSMQYGVYEDFFAENKLYFDSLVALEGDNDDNLNGYFKTVNYEPAQENDNDHFDNLNKARIAQIKLANQMYNEKHK